MTTRADFQNILLGQWRTSPRMVGLIDLLAGIRDNGIDALQRIELMQGADDAEGVWLDYLGARVGIDRPATSDPSSDPRFGFDDAGRGFDQVPFRGAAASDAVFPLPDTVYRRFVKARGILVLGDGTIQTFASAVRQIDPDATVTDNRDMTVTVTTDQQDFLELADEIQALPRTAGVRIIYA